MLKKSRLNNLAARRERESLTYETMMADLVLLEGITKEQYSRMTGREFPEHLTLPPEIAE